MKRLFVDSSFLVAYHHVGDPFYEKARRFMNEEVNQYRPFRFVITDYIFDEFVTTVLRYVHKNQASKVGQSLLEDKNFGFEWITKSEFDEAWDVFVKFRDKDWSFTDCTSYAWMKRNRPDFCLATDKDFNEFGLVQNLVRL